MIAFAPATASESGARALRPDTAHRPDTRAGRTRAARMGLAARTASLAPPALTVPDRTTPGRPSLAPVEPTAAALRRTPCSPRVARGSGVRSGSGTGSPVSGRTSMRPSIGSSS